MYDLQIILAAGVIDLERVNGSGITRAYVYCKGSQ